MRTLEHQRFTYLPHRFPLHLHPDYWTFSRIVTGAADLVAGDSMMRCQAGDIILIPPNVAHRTLIKESFTYELVRIAVKDLPTIWQGNFSTIYPLPAEQFSSWFTQLFYQKTSNAHFEQPQILNKIAPLPDNHLADKLIRVVDFFRNHLDEKITLHDLSAVALLSTAHLQRSFKQQYGISPMQFLQSLRVDRAKALMRNSVSLTEVAHTVGFYDQSHFYKYFRQLTGMKPSQYRRTLEND